MNGWVIQGDSRESSCRRSREALSLKERVSRELSLWAVGVAQELIEAEFCECLFRAVGQDAPGNLDEG
jgi:hypothetical protein